MSSASSTLYCQAQLLEFSAKSDGHRLKDENFKKRSYNFEAKRVKSPLKIITSKKNIITDDLIDDLNLI